MALQSVLKVSGLWMGSLASKVGSMATRTERTKTIVQRNLQEDLPRKCVATSTICEGRIQTHKWLYSPLPGADLLLLTSYFLLFPDEELERPDTCVVFASHL